MEYECAITLKEDEIISLEGRLDVYTSLIPLEVAAFVENDTCYLRITNKNHSCCGTRIKLKTVQPPFQGPPNKIPGTGRQVYESNEIELASATFEFSDSIDGYLDNGESGVVPLFRVQKMAQSVSLYFYGKWKPTHHSEFIAEGEHTIIFDLLSSELDSAEHKLKVSFMDEGWNLEITP